MSIVTTMKELMKNINMIPELCAKLADVEKNVDSHTIALQKLHQALQEETKKQTETLQGMSQEIAGVGTNVDASAAQIMVQGSEKAEGLQQVLSALHASQAKGVEDLRAALEETARKQAEALQGISSDMVNMNTKMDASAAQIMTQGDVKADELQKMLSTIDASHLSGLQDVRHFQEDAAQQQSHLIQDVRTHVAGVSAKLDAAVEQMITQRTEENDVIKETLSALNTSQTNGVENVRTILEETAQKQAETLQEIQTYMSSLRSKMDSSITISSTNEEKLKRIHEEICTMDNAAKLILLGAVMSELDDVNSVTSKSE